MRKKCMGYGRPKRGPYPKPRRAYAPDFQFKDEAAREKSLMRHPWYRKKTMWDAIRDQRKHERV